MGIGDWGLGIGDWGLGIGPNPHYLADIIKNTNTKLISYYNKFNEK